MINFEIIETRQLWLKGLSPYEMKNIFENHTKPEIKKILGHRSEEDFLKEESKHKNGYSSYNRSFMVFLLTDKTTNSIIGRCGLHNWNIEHKRAEIGYVMEDENYKQKGLMSEAIKAIIEYGFNKMNLNRIEALVSTENIPSLKLLKKFKFNKEGVLKQHYKTEDRFENSALFSILYNEYINDKNEKTQAFLR